VYRPQEIVLKAGPSGAVLLVTPDAGPGPDDGGGGGGGAESSGGSSGGEGSDGEGPSGLRRLSSARPLMGASGITALASMG
jgi:hypothetical protein